MRAVTLEIGGLILRRRLLVVHHALDDAVDRVQKVGVLAHGQHSVDLGVQQVVAEETPTKTARLSQIHSVESKVSSSRCGPGFRRKDSLLLDFSRSASVTPVHLKPVPGFSREERLTRRGTPLGRQRLLQPGTRTESSGRSHRWSI